MIIEAARGGHTGVVNLLLRQPRFTEALRKQMKAQRSAVANGDQRLKGSGEQNRFKIPPRNIPRNPLPRSIPRNLKNSGETSNSDHTSLAIQQEVETGSESCNHGNCSHGNGVHIHGTDENVLSNRSQKKHDTLHQTTPPIPTHSPTPPTHPSSVPPTHLASAPPTHPIPLLVGSSPSTQESSLGESFSGTVRFSTGGVVTETPSKDPLSSVGMFPLQPHPPPAGTGYLLPSVFSESPAYVSQERMEAYLKADEILRNHMSQLDYPKQQALMSALENLMVQSEAHRANMSAVVPTPSSAPQLVLPIDGDVEAAPLSNLVPPTQGAWSFTDPSRMPQFAIGASTVVSPDKHSLSSATNSPSKMNSGTSIVSSSGEPVSLEPHPPSVFDLSAPSHLPSPPVGLVHQSSAGATDQGGGALNPPPTLVNHGQFFQPIYTPNMGVGGTGGGAIKQLSHALASDDPQYSDNNELQSLTNAFFVDASFPVDIPPPSDLIPDHVS